MANVDEYKPGTFCWIDLGTTDQDGARKFYGELFGWSFNDKPVDENNVYTMLQKSGKDVAGLYRLGDEMQKMGVPPHWLSYVAVDSADDVAKKAKELGADIKTEPFDVFDVGRMAVVTDPTGATFALWEPKAHKGAAVVNEANSLVWNELLTNNIDKAGAFYTDLFGWGSESKNVGQYDYTSFLNGEKPAGGMMEIQKEWGEVPPSWLVYFSVDDCGAMIDKAKKLGATILSGPDTIPDIGTMATVKDPQGAVFAIIKLANPSA